MTTATFSVGIYRAGRLINSYLIDKEWDEIEDYVQKIEAENRGCCIECEEHEEYRGQYDDEIVQD